MAISPSRESSFTNEPPDASVPRGGSRINSDQVRARGGRLEVELLDDRVIVEGPLKLFRFADPDGNVLELFSLNA